MPRGDREGGLRRAAARRTPSRYERKSEATPTGLASTKNVRDRRARRWDGALRFGRCAREGSEGGSLMSRALSVDPGRSERRRARAEGLVRRAPGLHRATVVQHLRRSARESPSCLHHARNATAASPEPRELAANPRASSCAWNQDRPRGDRARALVAGLHVLEHFAARGRKLSIMQAAGDRERHGRTSAAPRKASARAMDSAKRSVQDVSERPASRVAGAPG